MFDATSFALFFVASWALIITPGPDMLYVITRGIIVRPVRHRLLDCRGLLCRTDWPLVF